MNTPIVGKEYLWDFGGHSLETVTVKEVMTKTILEITHKDGSISPAHDQVLIRINDCQWVGWYDGLMFRERGTK